MTTLIRPLSPDRALAAYHAEMSPSKARGLLVGCLVTEEQFRSRTTDGILMIAAVVEPSSDEVIGIVGIDGVNLTLGVGSLFLALYQQSGLVWEGVGQLTLEAFSQTPLRRLYLEVFASDTPHVKAFLPDFEMQTPLAEHRFHDSKRNDVVIWSVERPFQP
jgi:RimJ/RimL family protein N-acetyltransferase